mmetsp:Transcript_17785/g.51900  ORF Transcript_17785/g.51900 Transcript_17785/m.51900 type:complete len:268 (-) Transcript_17785:74-877(-)
MKIFVEAPVITLTSRGLIIAPLTFGCGGPSCFNPEGGSGLGGCIGSLAAVRLQQPAPEARLQILCLQVFAHPVFHKILHVQVQTIRTRVLPGAAGSKRAQLCVGGMAEEQSHGTGSLTEGCELICHLPFHLVLLVDQVVQRAGDMRILAALLRKLAEIVRQQVFSTTPAEANNFLGDAERRPHKFIQRVVLLAEQEDRLAVALRDAWLLLLLLVRCIGAVCLRQAWRQVSRPRQSAPSRACNLENHLHKALADESLASARWALHDGE